MKSYLISVTTSYACAAIVVNQIGIITDAAPIFKYAIGKRAIWFKNYLKRKGVLEEWYEHSRDSELSQAT